MNTFELFNYYHALEEVIKDLNKSIECGAKSHNTKIVINNLLEDIVAERDTVDSILRDTCIEYTPRRVLDANILHSVSEPLPVAVNEKYDGIYCIDSISALKEVLDTFTNLENMDLEDTINFLNRVNLTHVTRMLSIFDNEGDYGDLEDCIDMLRNVCGGVKLDSETKALKGRLENYINKIGK